MSSASSERGLARGLSWLVLVETRDSLPARAECQRFPRVSWLIYVYEILILLFEGNGGYGRVDRSFFFGKSVSSAF